MGRINTSPEALRDFAKRINSFIDEQEELLRGLYSHYTNMKSEWNDSQYEAFGENIEEIVRSIRTVIPKCEDTIQYLEKKADKIDDYLNY